MRVPVVLPVVHVNVVAHGRLMIDIDGNAYEPASVFTRRNVGEVLDQIATTLESPVRVELREADGTTYADIATPPDQPEQTAEPDPAKASDGTGTGFQPGEEIAFAYVLTRQIADAGGNAPLSLPPALLASRREGLLMIGLTSHVVANIQ